MAKRGVEVATGYVSLTSSAKELVAELKKEFNVGMKQAGEQAGDEAGKAAGKTSGESFKKNFDGEAVGRDAGMLIAKGIAAVGLATAVQQGLQGAISASDLTGTIMAQTGASEAEAKELGAAVAGSYQEGWGESLDEVAAMTMALTRTLGEELSSEEISLFSNAANILGYDAEQIGRSVMTMMRTGLADNKEEALGVLISMFQSGGDVADDMLDTFSEYSTQFRKLGLDGASSAALMSQAVAAGARDSDTAADALKEFSIRAVDMSAASQDAFTAIGLDGEMMASMVARGGDDATAALDMTLEAIKAMPDPVAQSVAAVGLFGTKAEDLGAALFAMDVGAATSDVRDFADVALTEAQNNEGLQQKLDGVGRSLLNSLVVALEPTLPMIESFASGVGRVASFLNEYPALTQGILLVTGGILGAKVATEAWTVAMNLNPATRILSVVLGLMTYIVDSINQGIARMDKFGASAENMFASFNPFFRMAEEAGLIGDTGGFDYSGMSPEALRRWNQITGDNGSIPGLATGGTVTRGGLTWVGENGPELLNLPTGAGVAPPVRVGEMMQGSGGGQTNNFYVYNPIAEPTSATVRQAQQRLAAQ